MPRANRYFIPGQIWHITHRCHKKAFLLKFAKDRRRWLHWLFQAKKRYGLRILNYAMTPNHIHLLVMDGLRRSAIPASMDLVSGRVAQEFNQRKKRSGAFWQDRYHGTAIESGEHLKNCMVYIDLNMVRAGVVRHPREWPHGGYKEICSPRQRYSLIHWRSLLSALEVRDRDNLKQIYPEWVEEGMKKWGLKRDTRWTESVAVGSKEFIDTMAKALTARIRGRKIEESFTQSDQIDFVLREPMNTYKVGFRAQNCIMRRKRDNNHGPSL